MGLFKKVKDILFDEEEDYTEQIKITPEMRNETPKKEEAPVVKKVEPTVQKDATLVEHSEKEVFKNNAFPFWDDFDEEEFVSSKPQPQVIKPAERKVEQVSRPTSRYSNVLDYERKKKIEKRQDFGGIKKLETTETIDRKKFKPSPIISPVYGVLDRDYKKEDIEKLEREKVDVQKVRDKAFGTEDKKPVKTYYDQSETVTLSAREETEEKVKTIDELLEDTSDVTIDIDNDLENELKEVESKIEPNDNVEITKEVPKIEKSDESLENDLFDLIDSMYDSKDGE